jgi:iron complex transport system substrate-binding protein
LSRDPADSSLWQLGQRYPGNSGNLESALKSRPNLVLTMGGGGRSTVAIARKMGLKTVDLPFPMSIDDVARNLSTVASALGEPHRADAWRLRLAGLRGTKLEQQDAIFLGAGGNSVGAQSVEAEWMGLAGLKQRPLPGGRASLELLATRPPAILLRSSYRRSERSIGQTWLEHPLARPKSSHVLEVDGRPWTCAGPLMLGEVERLRKLL